MSGRKNQAILEPKVGMVVREDDPRGAMAKTIVGVDKTHVIARNGLGLGEYLGRHSRISRERLAQGRYILLREPA